MTFDEIGRVIAAFADLGVEKIRITGGEPLVRKNLPDLARRLSAIEGINDLSLSTNAVQLSRYASALKSAKVSRINVSLDSLQAQRFKDITNGGKLEKVLSGLMAAKEVGFQPIKINMVVMKGVNDDEVSDMVEFCVNHGFTLRFIETMPMGDTGRSASNHYLSLETVKQQLQQQFDLIPGIMPGGGPARYMQVAGTDMKIGFITPISQHFCETCNRVRLSADGTLYLCLGQEDKVELRPLLRAGADRETLKQAIIDAIARKPERHEFREKPQQLVRIMSITGG